MGFPSATFALLCSLGARARWEGRGDRTGHTESLVSHQREAQASPDPLGLFRPLHMGVYPARQRGANHLAGNPPARGRAQARDATLAWLAAGRDAPFTLSEMMQTTHSLWLGVCCVPIGAQGWLEALAWCRWGGNVLIVPNASLSLVR